MVTGLNVDIETCSAIDLRASGVANYVWHPKSQFRILCLSYRLPGGEVTTWKGFYDAELNPTGTELMPDDIAEYLAGDGPILAWNAAFERAVLEWCGSKDPRVANIDPKRYVCTMQRAIILGLPGALGTCGQALRCDQVKDGEGKQVMLSLSKPRLAKAGNHYGLKLPRDGKDALEFYVRKDQKDLETKNDKMVWERFETTDRYCEQDVLSEDAIESMLPELHPIEKELSEIDAEVNSLGLPVDMVAIDRALELNDYLTEAGHERMRKLTDGAVPKATNVAKLQAWLIENGVEEHRVQSLAKAKIEALLEDPGITDAVKEVLHARLNGASAALKKLKAIKTCAINGRVPNSFAYSAAHTGRWAGRGIQPQNIFQGTDNPELQDKFFAILKQDGKGITTIAKELEEAFADVPGMDNLVDLIKNMLRGFIQAPEGKSLYVCDLAGIENRVLAWLAGETALLDGFRNGEDLYIKTASGIYDIDPSEVTKKQRQLGKIAVLAAQFGMGAVGYQRACGSWGIDVDKKTAEQVVSGYRSTYKNVCSFWYALQQACIRTVHDGEEREVGLLRVTLETLANQTVLRVWAPHGQRAMNYWNPQIAEVQAPWSWYPVSFLKAPTMEQVEATGMQPVIEDKKLAAKECIPAVLEKLISKGHTQWAITVSKLDNFKEVMPSGYELGSLVVCTTYKLYHEQKNNRGKWDRVNVPADQGGTWHGTLAENITQMVAREVLAHGVIRLARKGYKIIGYVHDEIIAEVDDSDTTKSYEEFERLMLQAPQWTQQGDVLPIDGEGAVMKRYRK